MGEEAYTLFKSDSSLQNSGEAKMHLLNIALVVFSICILLAIYKVKRSSLVATFNLTDLSKVIAILLVYYGVIIFYFKFVAFEENHFPFFLLIRILLTVVFILLVVKYTPFAKDVKNVLYLPRLEQSVLPHLIILSFFLYTSFTVFWAVHFLPQKVDSQLQNFIILKAINEQPFIAVPIAILTEIIAVVGEEIVFRYFAINALKSNLGKKLAVVTSALIWTLAHGEVSFGIFVLGVLLGYLYYETESLSLCIVLHFIFNIVVGTEIFYLFYKDVGAIALSTSEYAVILFFLQACLFYGISAVFRKKQIPL